MLVPFKRFFYVSCALMTFWILPLSASHHIIEAEIAAPHCVVNIFKSWWCGPMGHDHVDDDPDPPSIPAWLHWAWPTAWKAKAIIKQVDNVLNDPAQLYTLQDDLRPHYDESVPMTRAQVAIHLLRMHVNTLTDVYLIDELVRRYPRICSAPRVWYAQNIDEVIVSQLQGHDRNLWIARGNPASFAPYLEALIQQNSNALRSTISKWAERGVRSARAAKVKGLRYGCYGFKVNLARAEILNAIWFGYDREETCEVLPMFGCGPDASDTCTMMTNVEPYLASIVKCDLGTRITAFSILHGLLGLQRDLDSARRLILLHKIAY